MSQKATMKTLEVPVNQLKPSPYQPRITFNLEDIRGSVQRDGILVPLTVRKKDGYYELVDGERRIRLAKELGYKTVPVTVIDANDDTARQMVWKVNTLRQDYTPKEKAFYFKKLQEPPFGMSLQGMAKETDMGTNDVKAYLNVLKLPEDYQEMVWNRIIPIRNIRELDQLFSGVSRVTPEKNPQLFELLDRSSKEKHFGAEQIREAMKTYLTKLRKEQVKKATEIIEEIEPEVMVPETPEQFEEAAKVLRREAKRRKTPKQIHEEQLAKASKMKENVTNRLENVRELVASDLYLGQMKTVEPVIKQDPEKAISELKSISQKLQSDVKKAKEEKDRKLLEKETRQKVERELLKDEKFLRKAAELAPPESLENTLKKLEPEVRAMVLDEKNRLSNKVIVAISELEKPDLQKNTVKFIQTHGYNEDYALRFIERAKQGELITDVTVINEPEDVLKDIRRVYETVASWGVNERMILGSRWNEALQLFDRIEEKIRELRETHFYAQTK